MKPNRAPQSDPLANYASWMSDEFVTPYIPPAVEDPTTADPDQALAQVIPLPSAPENTTANQPSQDTETAEGKGADTEYLNVLGTLPDRFKNPLFVPSPKELTVMETAANNTEAHVQDGRREYTIEGLGVVTNAFATTLKNKAIRANYRITSANADKTQKYLATGDPSLLSGRDKKLREQIIADPSVLPEMQRDDPEAAFTTYMTDKLVLGLHIKSNDPLKPDYRRKPLHTDTLDETTAPKEAEQIVEPTEPEPKVEAVAEPTAAEPAAEVTEHQVVDSQTPPQPKLTQAEKRAQDKAENDEFRLWTEAELAAKPDTLDGILTKVGDTYRRDGGKMVAPAQVAQIVSHSDQIKEGLTGIPQSKAPEQNTATNAAEPARKRFRGFAQKLRDLPYVIPAKLMERSLKKADENPAYYAERRNRRNTFALAVGATTIGVALVRGVLELKGMNISGLFGGHSFADSVINHHPSGKGGGVELPQAPAPAPAPSPQVSSDLQAHDYTFQKGDTIWGVEHARAHNHGVFDENKIAQAIQRDEQTSGIDTDYEQRHIQIDQNVRLGDASDIYGQPSDGSAAAPDVQPSTGTHPASAGSESQTPNAVPVQEHTSTAQHPSHKSGSAPVTAEQSTVTSKYGDLNAVAHGTSNDNSVGGMFEHGWNREVSSQQVMETAAGLSVAVVGEEVIRAYMLHQRDQERDLDEDDASAKKKKNKKDKAKK